MDNGVLYAGSLVKYIHTHSDRETETVGLICVCGAGVSVGGNGKKFLTSNSLINYTKDHLRVLLFIEGGRERETCTHTQCRQQNQMNIDRTIYLK